MYRHILVFIISAWLALNFHLPAQSQQSTASMLAQKAQQFYQAGELSQSAITWKQAASAYQSQGKLLEHRNSLINQSQALQNLGLYPKSCKVLLKAFAIKNAQCNVEKVDQLINVLTTQESKITTTDGVGLRGLGTVIKRQGMVKRAHQLLKLSEAATRNSSELANTLLALGNVETVIGNQTRDRWNYDKITEIIDRQDPNIALEPYSPAFAAYDEVEIDKKALPITQVQAEINKLALLIEIENWWQTQTKRRLQSWQRSKQLALINSASNFTNLLKSQLKQNRNSLINDIESRLQTISPGHQGIYARINYSKSLGQLGEINRATATLQQALKQAQELGDRPGESYVLGYLGKYSGQQGDINQAIALTNQALILAQDQNTQHDARELTYLWQSQLGKLLEQEQQKSEAIEAYTSAFNTLQSLRTDLNVNRQVIQFDFRQEVKPVYMSLANLLLESEQNIARSKSITSLDVASIRSEDPNPNLELARQVIESLQLAELDNYFQDPCSETSNTTVTIDQLDPQAAVIYPIILNDRLDVILSVAGKPLQKFSTTVDKTEVNQTLDLLYDNLYNQSVDNSAVNIFSTTPINPNELADNTRTLIPLLQQIHSWLIEPLVPELELNQIKTLVFVLNGRLQNVPMAALYDGKSYLLENYGVALAPSLQLLNTKSQSRKDIKVLAAGLSEQVEAQGNIFPALNNVPEELKQIKAIFPQSQQLLNQDFTVNNIKKQLQKGFSIVHLATHGLFSSDPNKTFIVTGDRNTIDINALSTLLGSNNSNKPELVVLSACDTATGDERAILGFAGVAVRSGSSTLASLWSVDDASTAKLMSQFYREFSDPAAKKVDALQKAQLHLIESLRANPTFPDLKQLPPNPTFPDLKQLPPHPYYWAPYVLVGNWQ